MAWTLPNLKRGTVVEALEDLDPDAANVKTGDMGVVFEVANFYGDGCGPMVAWIKKDPYGCLGFCNVYEGQVKIVAK